MKMEGSILGKVWLGGGGANDTEKERFEEKINGWARGLVVGGGGVGVLPVT